ncbi:MULTISPECIES: glycosyltransferase family 4 protein [unclassified Psychrobacter]|uniref:glycosyltransferase family 4 protein n=1 Tax=unclassified Psychrobacter TaxID=196806 RepID=UPI003FD195BD
MKVIHLIPSDGLGGVEQAARSIEPTDKLNIEVAFISGESLSNQPYMRTIDKSSKLNSLRFYKSGFNYLLDQKPDLLVCSLWRTSIIGIAYSIYRRAFSNKKLKLVVFIHADKFAHRIDKIVTSTAIFLADEVWCDSQASKDGIFPSNKNSSKTKVISFFTGLSEQVLSNDRKNNFVFWGRLAKQKRLDKAICFFESINKHVPEAMFYIFGPDRGELDGLQDLVKKLRLENNVLFMGEKVPNHYPEEALSSKFFINTSSHEGMAIAVTEAMQLGLVPIVTPVGEIANYCIDGSNSIHYKDGGHVLENVLNAISDRKTYERLSGNAHSYWNQKVDYSTDFNQNCLRILSIQ